MNYMDELVSLLRSIGLNQYEARTYASLLLFGDLTAGELSNRAGLPRPRVYDIVNNLVKKGFVLVQPGRPVKYRAVPPSEAIENYIRLKKEMFDKEIEKIKNVGQELQRIDLGTKKEKESTGFWLLNTDNLLRSRLQSLIRSSMNEVVVAMPTDFLLEYYGVIAPFLEEATNRGVRVKMIVPKGVSGTIVIPGDIDVIETDSELPPVILVDSKKAFVGIPKENKGVLVEHPEFSKAFKRMLESVL